MRILHISTRLILGGSQENTVLSCEGQARLGHKVHLAFGPIYGPEGSLLARVEAFNSRCKTGVERTSEGREVCPIVLHTVPHLMREVRPWADWRAYCELKDLIRRLMPDVVHTHSSKAGIIGRAAAWAILKSGGKTSALLVMGVPPSRTEPIPRVVHTVHGPPFMPVEGTLFRQLRIRVANGVYTLAERFAAGRCHRIITVADAMKELFLSKGIGRADQYSTVYSGMEVAEFTTPPATEQRKLIRSSLGLRPDDFVIGTVARLAEHKGHDDLLDALQQQLAANPTWKLLWVGDGWWRARLMEKARAMGLNVSEIDGGRKPAPDPRGQVMLTGLVPSEAVPPLIRAMDVLVHPSYREGLPRTVPQALLSNVCPVAYDVDGTGEVCREMETGRLVPLADLTKLREAIVWCDENPVGRAALAMRGKNECVEKFSAAAMVASLERVYEQR